MFKDESSASACSRLAEDVYGPMSGQVTSVARQAFRRAVLEGDPRLVEAMFLCEVSTTAEALSGGTSGGQPTPGLNCSLVQTPREALEKSSAECQTCFACCFFACCFLLRKCLEIHLYTDCLARNLV